MTRPRPRPRPEAKTGFNLTSPLLVAMLLPVLPRGVIAGPPVPLAAAAIQPSSAEARSRASPS